jgi:GNAT superfamily N-acetyltransferase
MPSERKTTDHVEPSNAGAAMDLTYRKATEADLPAIVELLTDDVLGAVREIGLSDLSIYRRAFQEIATDPNQLLCVVESDNQTIGTLQLTFIAGMSRRGAKRGLIEAVRVERAHRGKGVGREMIAWAIQTCKEHGCVLVQLTTDKSRDAAHRFYSSLGFEASHVGFKLWIGTDG